VLERGPAAGREVARPDDAEDEHEDAAREHGPPRDDEADEQARDAECEADRPEARRRGVRLL
jgi:hypothetical protein